MKKLMIFFFLTLLLSLSEGNAQTPQWSDNSVNNTLAGKPTLFSVRWTDPVGLSGYIFSTNNTGRWFNDTFTEMTGTDNWSNVTLPHEIPLTDDTVSFWRFNEDYGNTTYDASTNDNDGELGNSSLGDDCCIPAWADGKFNSALEFDGDNDYVNVTHSDSLNITQEITLESWVYLSGLKELNPILRKGSTLRTDLNEDGVVDGLDITIHNFHAYFKGEPGYWRRADINGDGVVDMRDLYLITTSLGKSTWLWSLVQAENVTESKIQYYKFLFSLGKSRRIVSSRSLTSDDVGNWFHIAATYDGSTVSLFINGQLDTSVSATGDINSTDDNLHIGSDFREDYSNGTDYFNPPITFNGTIDEVRILNRSLTADEIYTDYATSLPLNSSGGTRVCWEVYANDTSNNWKTSDEFCFITTEKIPPKYFDNSTSSTALGTPVEFRLRWTDNVGLSKGILSLDNCTGTFVNQTWQSLSGKEDWLRDTYTINSTVDCNIRWKQYINDTSNNWNVSEEFSFVTTLDIDPPLWDNLRHKPQSVIELDSVDIKVEWSDNQDLNTVIIYENSTGAWEEHICDKGTGVCSGEGKLILTGLFITIVLITSLLIFSYVSKIGLVKIGINLRTILLFINVILCIFLISLFLFPELPYNISRVLMRLGIIPMVFPPKEFTHNIPETNLDLGEVVGYYSYAIDTSGNENMTNTTPETIRTFTVREITSYLTGYWKFDEGSGNMTYDASTNDNDGELGNSSLGDDRCIPVWETSDCHSGYCLYFDGLDDYVFVNNSSSMTFSYDTFTILVWIKTSSQTDQGIFDKYDWNVALYLYDTGIVEFYVMSTGTPDTDLESTTNISDGEWHHIAAVIDKPKGAAKLYIDSVEEDSTTSGTTETYTEGDIYIGTDWGNYFNGTIDEIKIYKRALSAGEIQNEYLYGYPYTTTTTISGGESEGEGEGPGGPGGPGGLGPSKTTTIITTISTTSPTTTALVTTTAVTTCLSTGEACESNEDCCSGYCCDGFCSDVECEEGFVFKAYHSVLVLGIVSAGIIGGYIYYNNRGILSIYYNKFMKVKAPKKVAVAEKIKQEFQTLRTIAEDLKIMGYDVSEYENELNLAENALKKGLENLVVLHLKRSREIINKISKNIKK